MILQQQKKKISSEKGEGLDRKKTPENTKGETKSKKKGLYKLECVSLCDMLAR